MTTGNGYAGIVYGNIVTITSTSSMATGNRYADIVYGNR